MFEIWFGVRAEEGLEMPDAALVMADQADGLSGAEFTARRLLVGPLEGQHIVNGVDRSVSHRDDGDRSSQVVVVGISPHRGSAMFAGCPLNRVPAASEFSSRWQKYVSPLAVARGSLQSAPLSLTTGPDNHATFVPILIG